MEHTIIEYLIMLNSTIMCYKGIKIIVILLEKDIKHD